MLFYSPFLEESRFRNPGKFCLRNLKSGKVCLWNPESWNQDPDYSSRNPEFL